MPRHIRRQAEDGIESPESFVGDAVPVDGVENQATRRAHMRAQTTARQAAEWHLGHPPIPSSDPDRDALVADRIAEVRTELARINDEHQTWQHDQHEESPDHRASLPPDYQAPK